MNKKPTNSFFENWDDVKIKVYLQILVGLILVISVICYDIGWERKNGNISSIYLWVIIGSIVNVFTNPLGWIAIALFIMAYRKIKILHKK